MRPRLPVTLAAALALAHASHASGRLADQPGRNDVRIWASPYSLTVGLDVEQGRLADRLEQLRYRRVHDRPQRPGEFFWGHEVFWIHLRGYSRGHDAAEPRLVALRLDRRTSRVVALEDESGRSLPEAELQPPLLGESFQQRRARRSSVRFEELPERVWRPLLAAEDSRFFDHHGLDGRSIARALLANIRAGNVTQGGSTITQQLIKMRDLSPRRSLGRKASEAIRALALEAEWTKESILEAYLDTVYYGHIDGVHLYGLGTASRAFYSTDPSELSLGQAAALAAVVQAPNRLSPVRNGAGLATRYQWILGRLEELDWATAREIQAARRRLPPLELSSPPEEPAREFRAWLRSEIEEALPERSEEDRGFIVESGLDLVAQEAAVESVEGGLAEIRRRHPTLLRRPLAAALVALDAETGDVLAWVSEGEGDFDRARNARRQPGSTVKPFVVLEAFDGCGDRDPIYPSRRVVDRALTVPLPSGDWSPVNSDGHHRGIVTVQETLVSSLNIPTVRLALWCGLEATSRTFGRAGLELPPDPPPAFVLGAVEASPAELAAAYTVFSHAGMSAVPRPYRVIRRPSGGRLHTLTPKRTKVARPESAFLVRTLLDQVLAEEPGAYGKTGTSSERRDAWFVGGEGSVVAAVWVGLDNAAPLGLTGREAAMPIWRRFMEVASQTRPALEFERPPSLAEYWIQPSTGLRVRPERAGAVPYLFHRRHLPKHRRWWRSDEPQIPIE